MLTLKQVVSRKTHGNAGTFDIEIDRDAPVSSRFTVEPRRDPTDLHRLFFTFNEPVTRLGGLTIRDKLQNPVGHATYQLQGNVVRLTLDCIPYESRLTIRLIDVNGPQDFSVSMGFLAGDVSGNGSVTVSDYLAARARAGQVNGNNFRADVNVSGSIDAIDQKTICARSGSSLP